MRGLPRRFARAQTYERRTGGRTEGTPCQDCGNACRLAAQIFRPCRCVAGGSAGLFIRARLRARARGRIRAERMKLTLRDLEVRGKRVLVRVDFNVPVEARDGKIVITDDTRIRASLPTINWLREHGAKTILMSHFGRPKGKRVDKYTLRPVADYLHTLINQPVIFSHDTIGEVPGKIVAHMQEGDVALLENLRFHPGEEANDPKFSEALARLGDLYVNEAFGAAHRAHASIAGITKFVQKSAMGLLMEKELHYLHEELDHPGKPFVVIMGGAKVSDKIGVLKALMEKADTILICGAMANTFFKAQGIPIGASRVEADKIDLANELLALAKKRDVKLVLPVDAIIAQEVRAGAPSRESGRLTPDHGIPDGWQNLDAGPETTAVKQAGVADKMTFISTGGGATLELLEGKELPGVAALTDKS